MIGRTCHENRRFEEARAKRLIAKHRPESAKKELTAEKGGESRMWLKYCRHKVANAPYVPRTSTTYIKG